MIAYGYRPGVKTTGGAHLPLLDLATGAVLTAVYVGFARMDAEDGQAYFTGPFWLGCLIAAAVGLPLAVRRRRPLPVLGVILAALVAASFLDLVREPYAAAGLAAYLVGLAEPARRSVPALALAPAVAGGAVYLDAAVVTPTEDPQGALGLVALVVLVIGGAWSAGFVVRGRRAEARRRQRLRAERALEEERLRIARELHDIVSHNLSLIAVKAGVAAHVGDADPREAVAALKVIEETSRSALAEMRRTLGVLRGQDAPLVPAPDLGGLDALAGEARRAGVDVDLEVRGLETQGAAGLTESLRTTVYRIVQEAVTNVARHAAPTRCAVRVVADAREIRVDVTDDGPPAGRGRPRRRLPGGHGLMGMRERALLYDGTFEAGPRPEGGFAVSVRLPRDREHPV
ncbi:integral membrane sensor signal transduction histidine kinase [Streptomyces laurentii]|uniref:histidine kinase n=1 Tax=Streptomyces laurentii TaxID=39478 RepID=A0A160P4S5_STRLU|nr:integral membrane sensor signal transduction histidine kinase [Streptomyces laurentii]